MKSYWTSRIITSLFMAYLLFYLQLFSCAKALSEISIQHTKTNGISYPEGYTSWGYFLNYPIDQSQMLLELRGHVLDERKYAGNSGLGWRYVVTSDFQFGLNTFYDFRQQRHEWFQQIGVGAEWLTSAFDVRANGYLPLDKTFCRKGMSHRLHPNRLYQKTVCPNTAYLDTLYRAFPVIEAEVGVPIANLLYLAGGTYYTFVPENRRGSLGKALGWQARFDLNLGPYVKVGSIFSEDYIFKRQLQGQIALHIPIGESLKKRSCACRFQEEGMRDFRHRKIFRRDIIPLLRQKETLSRRDEYKITSCIDEIENFSATITQSSETERRIFLEEDGAQKQALNKSEPMTSVVCATARKKPQERDFLGQQGLSPHVMPAGLLNEPNLLSTSRHMDDGVLEVKCSKEDMAPVLEDTHSQPPRSGETNSFSPLKSSDEIISNPSESQGILDRFRSFFSKNF